jgi:hypothetical protein
MVGTFVCTSGVYFVERSADLSARAWSRCDGPFFVVRLGRIGSHLFHAIDIIIDICLGTTFEVSELVGKDAAGQRFRAHYAPGNRPFHVLLSVLSPEIASYIIRTGDRENCSGSFRSFAYTSDTGERRAL